MTSHSRRSAALFPLIPPVHLPVSCRCTTHAPPLHGCALPPPPSPAYEQVHHICVRCNPEDVCRLALSCVEVAVEVQGSCSKQLGFQHAGHLHMGGEELGEWGRGGEGRGGQWYRAFAASSWASSMPGTGKRGGEANPRVLDPHLADLHSP